VGGTPREVQVSRHALVNRRPELTPRAVPGWAARRR
jgi:hypothetical protein